MDNKTVSNKDIGLNSARNGKKFWGVLIGAVVAAVVAVTVIFKVMNTPERRLARHLALGDQYITDGRYEDAIAEFTAAINIDPNSPDMIHAYIARGRIYAATDQPQGAVNDFVTSERLGESGEGYQSGDAVDQLIAAEIDQIIAESYDSNNGNLEMAADYLGAMGWDDYLPSENSTARPYVDAINLLSDVRDKVSGDHYDEALQEMQDAANMKLLKNVVGDHRLVYLYDSQNNILTAFYQVDAVTRNFENVQYMFYYGTGKWKDDQPIRSSQRSIWLGGVDDNKYISIGAWDNDMPNGSFESRSWEQSFNEQVSSRILSGKASEGLFSGEIQWTFENQSGEETTYSPAFQKGAAQNVTTDEDGNTVIYQDDDSGAKLVMPDNVGMDETFGIVGFAKNA